MADLATEHQRWTIFYLFEHFGIYELEQMKATAAQILKLDYLPDLRELTADDAQELIAELRRAQATRSVNRD